MECHGDEINSAMGRQPRTCGCGDCVEDRRCRGVVESCEQSLRSVMCRLLEAGMMPADIAEAVRRRTSKRSRAWMLTRIELTCQAGWWLSQPDWSEHLAEADELAKYTGFHVGVTTPGWMQRWYLDKGQRDLKVMTDSVLDVWVAMAPDLEDAWFEENERAALGGTTLRADNVIPFPTGPW